MQGWRKNMEDTHVTCLDLAPDISLFGVFDGHGGIKYSYFILSFIKYTYFIIHQYLCPFQSNVSLDWVCI